MDYEVLYVRLPQLAVELQVPLSAFIGRFGRVHSQFGYSVNGKRATESYNPAGSIMLCVAETKSDVIARAII